MSKPKYRPILFSGPMVRAIMEGRKTQSRRIVKFAEFGETDTPGYQWHFRGTRKGGKCGLWQDMRHEQILDLCPYGKPGDRLWVREKSRVESVTSGDGAWYSLAYAAGGGSGVMPGEMPGKWFPKMSHNIDGSMRWQPSIHMPRWASRITLEIVSVRVERLQDISEADATAEGCERIDLSPREINGVQVHPLSSSYFAAFAELWRSINGPGSWAANPWVWVVEFKRMENP